jgi:hypothetical protein
MTKDEAVRVRITTEQKQAAQQKAGDVPLSFIIRTLIRMWLNGEIEIKI